MKSVKYLVLLFTSIFIIQLQSQNTDYYIEQVDQGNNIYEYSLVATNGGQNEPGPSASELLVVWFFGDGHVRTGEKVRHGYEQMQEDADYTVTAYRFESYDPVPPPDLRYTLDIPNSLSGGDHVPEYAGPYIDINGIQLSLQPLWNFVGNADYYSILHLRVGNETDAEFDGFVKLDLDAVLKFEDVVLDPALNEPGLNGDQGGIQVNLQPGAYQNYFIRILNATSYDERSNPLLDVLANLLDDRRKDIGSTDFSFKVSQNPHDPNSKAAAQDVICADNNLQQTIDYTITFQNEGDGYADKVVITDQLSDMIDPGSVSFSSASHGTPAMVVQGNDLSIAFNDINLPGLRQVAPHEFLDHQTIGWVKFSVLSEKCLEEESIIYNQASIIFSTEDPILTNFAETLVTDKREACDEFEECGIIFEPPVAYKEAYPNPFKEQLNIEIPDTAQEDIHITVLNQFGDKMWESNPGDIDTNEVSIDTSDWPEGLYTIIISSENQVESQSVLKS